MSFKFLVSHKAIRSTHNKPLVRERLRIPWDYGVFKPQRKPRDPRKFWIWKVKTFLQDYTAK